MDGSRSSDNRMAKPTINLLGTVLSVAGQLAVHITYGSRFSFFIDFPPGKVPEADSVFTSLTLTMGPVDYLFGACCFVPESNIYGFSGRLIFTEDVYDFKSLIYERKVVTLETSFQNLSLILAQREKVKLEFKEYAANLTYDLEVYRHFFDELDGKYMDEPEHIHEVLQQTIINREGPNFMRFFDEKLLELKALAKYHTREENENQGFYFRKQVWGFILCSEILTRTNLKPRGYAGDSEMLNMVYQHGYRGKSTFSKLLHHHTVGIEAAQAVRNRRQLVAEAIRHEVRPAQGPLRVMSVACGSALELVDVFRSREDLEGYHFTLFDQDIQALSEAGRNVERVEERLHGKVKVDYVNASVRTMARPRQPSSELGQFDFIYALGLFDYLTPPVAKAVIEKVYALLNPGGKLVVGNYHVGNPDRCYMEYWMDWVLFYRTEEQFLDIAEDLKPAEKTIEFEGTRCQMFLVVRKPLPEAL